MWKWPKKKLAPTPAEQLREEIRQVEEDCLRRLNYVDSQLFRIARKKSHWRAAMTVADADILPMGRMTKVLTVVRTTPTWHRYAAIAGGAVLLFFLLCLALCG